MKGKSKNMAWFNDIDDLTANPSEHQRHTYRYNSVIREQLNFCPLNNANSLFSVLIFGFRSKIVTMSDSGTNTPCRKIQGICPNHSCERFFVCPRSPGFSQLWLDSTTVSSSPRSGEQEISIWSSSVRGCWVGKLGGLCMFRAELPYWRFLV